MHGLYVELQKISSMVPRFQEGFTVECKQTKVHLSIASFGGIFPKKMDLN